MLRQAEGVREGMLSRTSPPRPLSGQTGDGIRKGSAA